METQYLIDTNAVIEFLGGTLPDSGSNWLQNIIDQNLHHLSVINQIELLVFDGSPAEMQVLNDFIDLPMSCPFRMWWYKRPLTYAKTTKSNSPMPLLRRRLWLMI